MENIGNYLRVVRIHKGYTLNTLSKKIGISIQKLSRIEQGQEKIKEKIQNRLEELLQVKFTEDTEIDQEILDLFQRFCESVFFGEFDLLYYLKPIERLKDQNSKYFYLIQVMSFVIYQIEKDERCYIRSSEIKNIEFDQKAYCLYCIYRGVEADIKRKRIDACRFFNQAIDLSPNDSFIALAKYQMCFSLLDDYKLIDVLELLEQVKKKFCRSKILYSSI